MKLTIYTDGGARDNPGPAAIGIVIFHGKDIVKEYKKCLGIGTNNQAEYNAVIKALDLAFELKGTDLIVFSDSELLVRQLNSQYKVKNETLKKLYAVVKEKEAMFTTVVYTHVLRTHPGIVIADRLVNEALDDL